MDSIITALQALLQSAISGYTIFYGDEKIPARSELPLINIVPQRQTYNIRGTGGLHDNVYSIKIEVILDLRDYLKDNTNISVQTNTQALVKIVGEIDSNGVPKSTTVIGVLHANPTISNTTKIVNNIQADYENKIQVEGSFLRFATVTFDCIGLTPS